MTLGDLTKAIMRTLAIMARYLVNHPSPLVPERELRVLTEHAEGDSKEDNANVSLTDIDTFRSKMGKQIFARWTPSFLVAISRF